MSVFEYIFGVVGNGNNEETGKLVTLNLKSGKGLIHHGLLHPDLKDPDSINALMKVHFWLLEN